MLYIWLAIFAYFLFAINGVIDKFLLSKAVKDPAVYAFYTGITGSLTWLLIPFGFVLVGWVDFIVALAAGASFIVALFFFYKAVIQTSISRLLPIEGGLVPIFTLLLAYLIVGERLSEIQLFSFAFLVVGAVLISFEHDRTGWHPRAFGSAVVAAIFFAVSLSLTKYIFDQTNFVSGLIWTRLGFLLMSVVFLIPRKTRKEIFNAPEEAGKGNIFLYYGARVSGGLAGIMQNYAIAIGSVTIVNALQGTQYALLLLMTIVLSTRFPRILKEKMTGMILVQKIIAIVLIASGLVLLAF